MAENLDFGLTCERHLLASNPHCVSSCSKIWASFVTNNDHQYLQLPLSFAPVPLPAMLFAAVLPTLLTVASLVSASAIAIQPRTSENDAAGRRTIQQRQANSKDIVRRMREGPRRRAGCVSDNKTGRRRYLVPMLTSLASSLPSATPSPCLFPLLFIDLRPSGVVCPTGNAILDGGFSAQPLYTTPGAPWVLSNPNAATANIAASGVCNAGESGTSSGKTCTDL